MVFYMELRTFFLVARAPGARSGALKRGIAGRQVRRGGRNDGVALIGALCGGTCHVRDCIADDWWPQAMWYQSTVHLEHIKLCAYVWFFYIAKSVQTSHVPHSAR